MSTTMMIKLKSSDGELFEVEETVARQSETIAHIIDDGCADNEIPLANVNSQVLAKVIEYLKKHVVVVGDGDGEASSSTTSEESKKEVKEWDAEFVNIELSMIFDIILAANYLNIKTLLDFTCQTIADMITDKKTPEEIRAHFGIENDFTPEEYEQVRKENEWAFE